MTPSALVKLVQSLSGPEKRYFRLHSKMQGGDKDYLFLFKLIDEYKSSDPASIKEAFKQQRAGSSWDNTCNYLGQTLIESLVNAKKERDVFFDLVYQLLEVKILKERSLDNEAYKQIKKIQQKAAQFQLHWIEHYCCRYELNHHADNNFSELDDKTLVKIQMKGKEILKNLNHIHDHYALYELLKYRLIHSGKIVSEEGKKKLNDLILSEMVLVAGRSKSFTSQKLHLLFQSYFFTDVGDYHSALKSFYQLNELLEKNEQYLDNPPLDYLSALIGMIDSLRVLSNHTEISIYLDRLRKLDQPAYPEYFRFIVRKTTCSQQILTLLQTQKLNEAATFIDSIAPEIFSSYIAIDEEKQSELYFYCSLVHFRLGQWKKAHLYLREIMNQLKLSGHLLVSRAIRLLNIIIFYEKNELDHLEYEVRSYKRHFTSSKLRTEKLLFKLIAVSRSNSRLSLTGQDRKKMSSELLTIAADRYEQQLLKYFDFAGWLKKKLEAAKVPNLNAF